MADVPTLTVLTSRSVKGSFIDRHVSIVNGMGDIFHFGYRKWHG